jgi:hypothetical protein
MTHDPARVVPTVIRYQQWEGVANDNGYSSTKCIEKSDMAVNVAHNFEDALAKYAFHRYSYCNQYREIRKAKDSLTDGCLAIHMDFSENFLCKSGEEVQSAHFGYHYSVVLHQGILYEVGKEPVSFCTMSDDNRKTAPSIAAHLNSVLSDITTHREKWKKLFLFSDSPSSQYRNSKTIFLIDHVRVRHKFEEFEWIYTERGHGKSAADGVGAAVKRRGDDHISCGGSICNAEELCRLFSDSKIVIKKVRFS